MDSFIEHIVKRKKKNGDYLMMLCIILGGLILCFFAFGFGTIGAWIIVGIIYGMYRMITNRNIEYEYSLTNGDLDIDKIIAKRKRIKVISVHSKDFEYFARVQDPEHKKEFEKGAEKTVYAYCGEITQDTCFAAFYVDNVKTMLIFEPTEKMKEIIRSYMPSSLYFA